MGFKFGVVSKYRMRGVHPDLIRVMNRAIGMSSVDFSIIEGVRTKARQRILVRAGASQTLDSRHIPGKDGYGKALDIAPYVNGRVRWDWPLYRKLATVIKKAAVLEKVNIEWGGDWKRFKDGPHWQLSKKFYP